MITIEFVGRDTPNPKKVAIPNDYLNIGPAAGFAWRVPWFGEGNTTIRGGYQITYGGTGQADRRWLLQHHGIHHRYPPGNNSIANVSNYISELGGQYLDLRNAAQLVPVRPTAPAVPGGTLPIYSRANFAAYDPHYVTPYTQNFTLSITRNIRRNLTLDLRYVGTVSKKQDGSLNLNLSNVYHNPELFSAI